MKTKIIPFDLETAKKIQAGEIEGKIKTKDGLDVRVICWDRINEYHKPIVALINEIKNEQICRFSEKGEYDFGYNKQYDLVLEVPDNEPQFKVGDKVRIRPNGTHSHFVEQYDNCIGKIVGEHDGYFEVIATGAFQDQFTADELELVEETGKHEFKPFDKVLVRKDKDADEEPDTWVTSFFMSESIAGYRVLNGEWFDQCIPYEGNENLLGTTDKPKKTEGVMLTHEEEIKTSLFQSIANNANKLCDTNKYLSPENVAAHVNYVYDILFDKSKED